MHAPHWILAAKTFPFTGLILRTITLICVVSGSADTQTLSPSDWCASQQMFELHAKTSTNAAACPRYTDCDFPTVRNSHIPPPDQPPITIRLMLHILAKDDGSSPASDSEMIALQIANLNQDYAPSRIRFEYQYDLLYSTKYRSLSETEFDSMKAMSAVKPDSMLNIWVAAVEPGYSFGILPWDPRSLTAYGGIVLNESRFLETQSTLAHEVGHCLGLWHTHHGVSEVLNCSACYERAGSADGDSVGDFCEDTAPTPATGSCFQPTDNDLCTNVPWAPTDVENFMGYAGEACWSEFSAQQAGRMHCMINSTLMGWVTGVSFTVLDQLGPAPLQVDFSGSSAKSVTSWAWHFGDGQSSAQQSPSHTYADPGVYDVSLTIQSTSGPYTSIQRKAVWAYADTLWIDSAYGGPGQQIPVNVQLSNRLPLRAVIIPFSWNGPLDITLDSVSVAGLRTEYMTDKGFLDSDHVNRKAAFRLAVAEDFSQPDLAPGTGAVLRLYFRIPAVAGETVPLQVISYSNGGNSFAPAVSSAAGAYIPVIISGKLATCRAGDISGDGRGPDLTDLSCLIAYLISGQSLPNPSVANINGKGTIDLTDLSYLIAYLVAGGAPPVCG